MANSQPARGRHSWWTLSLGRIAGIEIRLHITLLVLLAWIAVVYAVRGAGTLGTLFGLALVVMVFAIIVVHELGHALMARRFGYKTRDIMLLPIGGIASLERIPERPSQELAVAVVGPLINLAIAGILALALGAAGSALDPRHATSFGGAFVSQLMWINVLLALFNLLPAFPMDGGRALRALLALRLSHERATDIAAALGKILAVGFGILGLFYNPFLVLIAVVVWIGATQERALVHLKSALAGVPVSAAMLTRVDTITPDRPLEDAAAMLLAGGQNQLPVMDHGAPVGLLTAEHLAAYVALHHKRAA